MLRIPHFTDVIGSGREVESGAGAPDEGPESDREPERAGHRLYAQILWTTLGERPLVGPRRAAAIEGHLIALCRRLDVEPVAVSVTEDRVHLLVRFKPIHSLSGVASRLKGGSSAALTRMCTPVRWGAGYAAASVGPGEVRRLMRELVARADRFARQGRRPRDPDVRAGTTGSAERRPGVTRVLTRLPTSE